MYVWCSVARPPGGWSCFFSELFRPAPRLPIHTLFAPFRNPKTCVLYTTSYVLYILYNHLYIIHTYILCTIYYLLYTIYVFGPPTPPQAHTAGGILTHPQGEGTHTTGGPATRNTVPYIIYIIMYVTIYIYTYICICAYCMRMGSIYLVLATSRVTYLRTTSPEIMNRIWESSHNDLTSHQFTRSKKIDGRDHLQEPPDI